MGAIQGEGGGDSDSIAILHVWQSSFGPEAVSSLSRNNLLRQKNRRGVWEYSRDLRQWSVPPSEALTSSSRQKVGGDITDLRLPVWGLRCNLWLEYFPESSQYLPWTIGWRE